MSKRLLIIEDDTSLNQMLQFHFEDGGFEVTGAESCDEGLQQLHREGFDLILLDQQLPDGTGMELLQKIRAEEPEQAIIMMTGKHDLELAIEAIKTGAADFIHKPLQTKTLQATVDKVLAGHAREPEPATADQASPVGDLIGRSEAMLEVSKQIALCSANTATVLITGESGTGKEVVARLIESQG